MTNLTKSARTNASTQQNLDPALQQVAMAIPFMIQVSHSCRQVVNSSSAACSRCLGKVPFNHLGFGILQIGLALSAFPTDRR